MYRSAVEHLAWCRSRALAYVDAGDLPSTWASLCSDLGKHPQTSGHAGIELGSRLLFAGHLATARQMRDFIEGLA
jgi:hypothetical protein